ncbi:cilia- and flagella-associated protein 43-like [Vespula squamosa]|uniref:Cilia- and flagella-associated protein 43-like n=1 Tax=Vespula squamosa TaxID=30214 RepID=A0ABD1ZVE2_VESSQ
MVMAAADLDESFVRFFSSAGSDMHNESFALEGSCGPRADTRVGGKKRSRAAPVVAIWYNEGDFWRIRSGYSILVQRRRRIAENVISILCSRMHRRRQKEDINLPVESAGAARARAAAAAAVAAAAAALAAPAVGCAVAPLSRPSSSTLSKLLQYQRYHRYMRNLNIANSEQIQTRTTFLGKSGDRL